MNFSGLKYFLAVADDGNITRTAGKLHMSQQSLSAQMNKLEKELGTRLFERSPAFSLTYAGERVRTLSEHILKLEREIREECAEISGGERARLNIGISYTCGHAVLPKILPQFNRTHPLVEITLMEGNSLELKKWLDDGTVDIVISFEKMDAANAEIHKLSREQLFLVVPKEMTRLLFGARYDELYAANTAEADMELFSTLPFIMVKRGNRSRSLFESSMLKDIADVNVVLETESIETALALAEAGMGATVYSELFLDFLHPEMKEPSGRNVDFFPIAMPDPPGELAICLPARGYRPRIADEFVRLSIELVGCM